MGGLYMSSIRESFGQFVLNNQRNLYWLYTASVLIMVANYFLAAHGYFEFEQKLLRTLMVDISLLAPTMGILVLGKPESRNYLLPTAICVFISMLFQLHFATLTCFVVLVFVWTKPNNLLAILILGFLQTLAVFAFFSEFIEPRQFNNLSSLPHLKRRLVVLQQEQHGRQKLYGCNYCVKIFFNVAGGLRLVKTYYTLYDEYGEDRPVGFKLEDPKDLSDSTFLVYDQSVFNPPTKIRINLQRIDNRVHWRIEPDQIAPERSIVNVSPIMQKTSSN